MTLFDYRDALLLMFVFGMIIGMVLAVMIMVKTNDL